MSKKRLTERANHAEHELGRVREENERLTSKVAQVKKEKEVVLQENLSQKRTLQDRVDV